MVVYVGTRAEDWYTRNWPRQALGPIASVTAADPTLRVMSDDRYADWILWEHPQLAGRVAYDVRFELFSDAQLRRLFVYRNRIGDGWDRAAKGYRLLALDRRAQAGIVRAALAERGSRVLYGDREFVVLLRSEAGRVRVSGRTKRGPEAT